MYVEPATCLSTVKKSLRIVDTDYTKQLAKGVGECGVPLV